MMKRSEMDGLLAENGVEPLERQAILGRMETAGFTWEAEEDQLSPDDVFAKLGGVTGPSIARAIATYHAMVTKQPPPPGVIVECGAYHLDQPQASKLEALAAAIREPREPEMADWLGAGTQAGDPTLFRDGDVRYPASLAEYTLAAQMYSRREKIAEVARDLRLGALMPGSAFERWADLLEGKS